MWVAIGILACVLTLTVITFGISKLNALESKPQTLPPPVLGANTPARTDDEAKSNQGEISRQSYNEINRPSHVSVTGSQLPSPITKLDKGSATSPKVSKDAYNLVPGGNNRRNTFSLPNLVVTTPEDRGRTGQVGRSMRSLPQSFGGPMALHPEDNAQKSSVFNSTDRNRRAVSSNDRVAEAPRLRPKSLEDVPRTGGTKPSSQRSQNTTQSDKARQAAKRLAKEAVICIPNLNEYESADWYGNLNFDTIHKIADGSIDPLLVKHDEHEIRNIPPGFEGRFGDFLNLGLSLHHFSAAANDESVRVHGLLSVRKAKELRIKPTFVSSEFSRHRDADLSLDQYVHLSFTNRSAMAYSVESRTAEPLVDYRVSPLVLNLPTTMFCRGYANARDAQWIPFSDITALDLIALFIGFDRMKYWQLMVMESIPTQRLRRDNVRARERRFANWL